MRSVRSDVVLGYKREVAHVKLRMLSYTC
jgi:hypothetical protein